MHLSGSVHHYFRYVSFSSFTIPLRLRPDIVVVAQLKTLCFELKSQSKITLSESQLVENDGIQGFQFGNQKKKGYQCLATTVHHAFEIKN